MISSSSIASALVGLILAPGLPVLSSFLPSSPVQNIAYESFTSPVDALSVYFPNEVSPMAVSGKGANGWLQWQDVEVDADVHAQESTLILFPESITEIRIRTSSHNYVLHPIDVSSEPAKYQVASTVAQAQPRILARTEWGADNNLLFKSASSSQNTSSANGETNTGVVPQRVADCEKARRDYPQEFTIQNTVMADSRGREYKWPLQYSRQMQMFVVHHTAQTVNGEKRTALERVRALYQYHTMSLGWGDIGYHYIIDESGQIYEGKEGGRYVIGGHAYCNNIGTVGVALLGNFETEQPSQKQVQSLQWLLQTLGQEYKIDPSRSVTFHGKQFASPIVRHRDLLSTSCPGFYLASAFDQVVANVRSGNVSATVEFPALPPILNVPVTPTTSEVITHEVSGPVTLVATGLKSAGGTEMRLNPGGQQRFDLVYKAPATGARGGSRIAQVIRSTAAIRILEESDDGRTDIRGALELRQSLRGDEEYRFQLVLSAPIEEGSYWFEIGGIRYTLTTAGRRSRLINIPQSLNTLTSPIYNVPLSQRSTVRNRPLPVRVKRRTFLRTQSSRSVRSRAAFILQFSSSISSTSTSKKIRVRLSLTGTPSVNFSEGGSISSTSIGTQSISLTMNGQQCLASNGHQSDIIRFQPSSGFTNVQGVSTSTRTYRGVIECRIVDGQLALINELPLEEYMMGLAEEPDTEPFEKQKAFAIAARSYAASYLDPLVRKFPGKPYDGSDSPALFQAYHGVTFEGSNPRWLRAVSETANQVLMNKGKVVRAPYFSSDDGRTRTPAEAGWPNFPNAELFASKPDPWCKGMTQRGHGVGMSGCGAEGQANEGKTGVQILQYYYPGAGIELIK